MSDLGPTQQQMVVEIAQDSTLHPRDPMYEDLETAKEYPHRFFVRPSEYTAQVLWEEPDEFGVKQLQGPIAYRLRSDHSKHPCYLRIKNKTPHKVRMLWLDYNGNEIAYEFVEPHGSVIQQTFTTHPWVVREITTCTQLLLNGCEAFIASQPMLEQSRQAAAAAAATAAAGSGVNAQQQAGQQNAQQGGGAAGGQQQEDGQAGLQQQVLQQGIPVIDVEVGELPQLIWTKEVHSCFPDSFKSSMKTFLLCHQKLQHAIMNETTADSRTHLGHVPSLLLPHIISMAAVVTPQGIHFPDAARTGIKPTLLPEPPVKDSDDVAADTAPAGQAEDDEMDGEVFHDMED